MAGVPGIHPSSEPTNKKQQTLEGNTLRAFVFVKVKKKAELFPASSSIKEVDGY